MFDYKKAAKTQQILSKRLNLVWDGSEVKTIGCAKSPFFPFNSPEKKRGSYTCYRNRNNEEIGYCVRTRTGVKPIFVSPGNKIDKETSIRLVLRCSQFRIPEPIRYAHKQATDLIKKQ